jgi:hypothetical protein
MDEVAQLINPNCIDTATKAKLDSSYVVICILPTDEKIVVRGQHFLISKADEPYPGVLVMTSMRVSSPTIAELMRVLLEQRPSPSPPSGWLAD